MGKVSEFFTERFVSECYVNVIFENGDLGLEIFQGALSTLLTHSFSGPADTTDGDLVDLSSFVGVTSVVLTHAFPDDYYLIDNVSFDAVAVPESATLGLLYAGLLGFVFVRRRAT